MMLLLDTDLLPREWCGDFLFLLAGNRLALVL
jgi:hypothetical protein